LNSRGFGWEILLKRPAVDGDLPFAGPQKHPRNRALSPAGS